LQSKVTCKVRTWDERLSTVAAQRALREAGKSVRQTRGYIDQVAAQMLLQSYLDSLPFNQGNLEPIA
jgi:putative Holliday junction resolvase